MNDTPASLDRRGLLAGGLAMAMASAVAHAAGPEAFALDDQQPITSHRMPPGRVPLWKSAVVPASTDMGALVALVALVALGALRP